MARPAAVIFDVIETLFPLDPLRPRLAALGLAPIDLRRFHPAMGPPDVHGEDLVAVVEALLSR